MGHITSLYPPQAPANRTLYPEGITTVIPQVADARADKFDFTFGENSLGSGAIYQKLITEGETNLRRNLSQQNWVKERQQRLDILREYIGQRDPTQASNPEELAYIAALSSSNPEDPALAFENELARRTVDTVMANLDPETVDGALGEDPEQAYGIMSAMQKAIAIKELANTQLDALRSEWADRNTLHKVFTFGETLLPFMSMENYMNEAPNARAASILPGQNIREQYESIALMPLDEALKTITEVARILKEQNILDAMHFMEGFISYTANAELLDNTLFADWAVVGGLAKVGVRAVERGAARGAEGAAEEAVSQSVRQLPEGIYGPPRPPTSTPLGAAAPVVTHPNVSRLREIANAVLRGTNTPSARVSDVAAATGNVRQTVITTAMERVRNQIRSRDPTRQFQSLQEDLISLINPKSWMQGARKLTSEAQRRLANELQDNGINLLSVLTRTNNAVRLNEPAAQKVFERAMADFKAVNPSVENAILDYDMVYGGNNLSNTYHTIVSVGTPDAQLFASREDALKAIESYGWKHLKSHELTIQQQGERFFLQLVKDADETAGDVRAELIQGDNVHPEGWGPTWFLRFLRSPEETLSQLHRENRHAVTHGSQNLHLFIKEVAKSFKLRKESRENLNRILTKMRDLKDEEGRVGQYFRTLGDFEMEWQNTFGKLPSREEARAYYTFVQINDLDWAMRNLTIYRDKARKGVETYEFDGKWFNPKGEKIDGFSPQVEVRKVDNVPFDEEDAGILVVRKGKDPLFVRSNDIGIEGRAEVQKLLDSGYSVFQTADPTDPHLRGATKSYDPTNFIIAKDFRRERLQWKQIPRREGGHVEYANRWYVKQPTVRRIAGPDGAPRRHIYEGDRSMAAFSTEAEARKYAQHYDTARQLYRDGKEVELAAYLKKHLPETPEQFKKYFEELLDKDGNLVSPAMLHVDDPISFTRTGQRLIDIKENELATGYKDFTDAVRSPYNLYSDVDKKFAGERADSLLPTIREAGTEENPLHRLEAPRLVDPLRTIGRALANSVRSRHFADYKIYAVESFIQEFKHLMRTDPRKLERDPLYYMHNPEWIENVPNQAELMAAKTTQKHIINLIGTEGNVVKGLNLMKERLLNTIYKNLGQNASDFVDEHLIHKIKDPARFMRAVAFHTKLGLFNPVQLWLQMQTLTHITALAPTHAPKALAAASLMMARRLSDDPKIRAHLGQISTKFGWKADEFEESLSELENTGWRWVEGETAWRDDVQISDKLVDTKSGQFLHMGTAFFRGGERITRLTAWNAAYLAWKKGNPGVKLNDRARNAILTRADDMSVNMTRASSATWQQGLLSLPTQFTSYQIRLWEQFLGHRLTRWEKARVIGVYSAMYGVPVTLGIPFALWPVHEEIRKGLMENGVQYDDTIIEGVMEGLQSQLLELAFGEDYDVSRFGPGGLNIFKDIVETAKGQGNKEWLDIIVGPSYSITGDMVRNMEPAIVGIFDALRTDGKSAWSITMGDLIEAGREISSVNNVARAIAMHASGRYMTENEGILTEADTMDGFLMAVFGVAPQDVSDAFLKIESMEDFAAGQKAIKDEALKYWRRAIAAQENGDNELASLYMRRAQAFIVMGDFRPDQFGDIITDAVGLEPNIVERVNQDFVDQAPWSQQQQRINARVGQ